MFLMPGRLHLLMMNEMVVTPGVHRALEAARVVLPAEGAPELRERFEILVHVLLHLLGLLAEELDRLVRVIS